MNSWSDGYVSDIGYTHGFYREMTPNLIRFIAQSRGAKAADGPINFFELGCGQGYTVNVLAAANPNSQFYANDFNPTHVINARTLAQDAGLTNAHFLESSFEELLDDASLPAHFDIIALHGVFSWISAKNREFIIQFIRKKLATGGMVYISFNALPGWSSFLPIRRLLLDVPVSNGSIEERIAAALLFVEQIKNAGAAYFSDQKVADRFDQMRSASASYLAHEYFNRDWRPFYFREVEEQLSGAKLSFLSSAYVPDLIDVINLSAEHQALISKSSDAASRETLRDFLINQQFRRDLFVRGIAEISAERLIDDWLDMTLAMTTARQDFPDGIKGDYAVAQLHSELYAPLLDQLASGPKTVRALLSASSHPQLRDFQSLKEAIQVLVATTHVQPCLNVAPTEEAIAKALSFNLAVLTKAEVSDHLKYLASPVTGGGVAVDRVDQLFLRARHQGDNDPVLPIWQKLKSQGRCMLRAGTALVGDEENIWELKERLKKFERMLPVYQSLRLIG